MISILDLHFLGRKHLIAAFLIRSKESCVLIETGPDSCFPFLEKALADHGLTPADIDAVLPTHIHLDHAGAAWRFAGLDKPVYVHPAGYRHMAQPQKLVESAKRIYLDKMDSLWGTLEPIPENRLVKVSENQTVQIGDLELTARFTPGHAKHHIAWQFEDVLFTGDVAGVRAFDGPVILPTPPPDLDFEIWSASLDKIEALAVKTIYLTHFGSFDDVPDHIAQQRMQMAHLREITKVAAQRYPNGEIPAQLLERFFGTYYTAFNFSAEAKAVYDGTSPDWMSAQGLTRYWKVKNQQA